MKAQLPENLLAEANELSRLACGPAHVKLILHNGRTIYDVVVSKGGRLSGLEAGQFTGSRN